MYYFFGRASQAFFGTRCAHWLKRIDPVNDYTVSTPKSAHHTIALLKAIDVAVAYRQEFQKKEGHRVKMI